MARACIVGLLLAGAALPAVAALPAGAEAATTPIKTGYYADIIKIPSAEVAFHLRTHSAVPDLVVICENPAKTSWLNGTSAGGIFVHMPKGTVHGGTISYDGTATVTPGFFGAKKVATTKLRLTLHHVDGPVLHYTFEGLKHTETRAWVGTVSTPACKSLPAGGRAKLYGPVPGGG
jgi:hypothetical protein